MTSSTSIITRLTSELENRLPIIATVVGSLAIAWLLQFFFSNDPLSKIPMVKSGKSWLPLPDAQAYRDGYTKV